MSACETNPKAVARIVDIAAAITSQRRVIAKVIAKHFIDFPPSGAGSPRFPRRAGRGGCSTYSVAVGRSFTPEKC